MDHLSDILIDFAEKIRTGDKVYIFSEKSLNEYSVNLLDTYKLALLTDYATRTKKDPESWVAKNIGMLPASEYILHKGGSIIIPEPELESEPESEHEPDIIIDLPESDQDLPESDPDQEQSDTEKTEPDSFEYEMNDEISLFPALQDVSVKYTGMITSYSAKHSGSDGVMIVYNKGKFPSDLRSQLSIMQSGTEYRMLFGLPLTEGRVCEIIENNKCFFYINRRYRQTEDYIFDKLKYIFGCPHIQTKT